MFLIKKAKSQCSKEEPIQTINGCENIYCTESQFQNGQCTISNSIIKKQWLNNIIKFENFNSYDFFPLQITDDEYIFISIVSSSEYENYAYFIYGIKSSGENHINEIISDINYDNNYLSAISVTINNKNYPLICNPDKCIIIDLENKITHIKDYYFFLQKDSRIFSQYNLIANYMNLDNKSKILFNFLTQDKIYLSIVNINNKELSSITNIHYAYENAIAPIERKKHNIFCLVTDNNLLNVYI